MTPEQFCAFADLLPEPMFLLSSDGLILASNQVVQEWLSIGPHELQGKTLADLAAEPADEIAHYLHLCSRNRKMVLGAMVLHSKDGKDLACRTEGTLVHPKSKGSVALLLLRLIPKKSAIGQFVALNQRIDELAKEIQRRKQAEELARQRQEQLRVTLHSIGDAVIVTDTQGRVKMMNPVAESLTGWRYNEATGQPLEQVFAILNEHTRESIENPALRALREGVIVGLANHSVLIAKDGTERPIDDSAAPIRDGQGEPIGAILVFRDISPRRQAESRVRASEERFQAFMENSPSTAYIKDVEGRYVYVNRVLERNFDRPMAAWMGKTDFDLFSAEQAEQFRQNDSTVLASGTAAQFTELATQADGPHYYLSFKFPLPDRDGRWLLAGMSIDITERKRAEQALRNSEERFRTLAETMPQLVWMAQPDGHIFWYNRRWYEYTGTTPEQMEGWGWQSVHDPAVLPEVLERWKASIANGEPFDMVFPLRGANGRYRPFLTRIVPLRDQGGRVIQWFGTNTDISAQQAMEEALREEDRRKDEFLALLAHELRNPLAPLRNGLQIMRRAGDNAEAVEPVRSMMERQLQHLVRLVDDLLDVSRIRRGTIELRKEPIPLAEVVGSALEACDPLMRQCGHELTVTLPEEPIQVDADKIRLTQALCNLLNNAAKYSEQGSRIWLTVQREGGEAVIRVKDTGIGIPAIMLPKVFDLFTQVDRSLEKSQGGLGIGLSIVKRLVELHGGTVEAESEGSGKGSEFIVRLPAILPLTHTKNERDGSGRPAPRTAQRRVLIADDNRDAAGSLAMLLQIMGSEVRTAHDGLEAVETAAAFRPELILLDIGMPKLNGYDVCRRIREQPWGKSVLIVALTGWGQDEDKLRSQQATFNYHFVKPIEPAVLEELLVAINWLTQ